jgi:predicted  nucleic acid-binding Zn-ribbon protein
MTTSKQDREFIETVVSSSLLDMSIGWIGSNLSPSDVFSNEALEQWAVDFSSLADEISKLKLQISVLESTEEELRDEKLILESTIEELREEIYSLQEKI